MGVLRIGGEKISGTPSSSREHSDTVSSFTLHGASIQLLIYTAIIRTMLCRTQLKIHLFPGVPLGKVGTTGIISTLSTTQHLNLAFPLNSIQANYSLTRARIWVLYGVAKEGQLRGRW